MASTAAEILMFRSLFNVWLLGRNPETSFDKNIFKEKMNLFCFVLQWVFINILISFYLLKQQKKRSIWLKSNFVAFTDLESDSMSFFVILMKDELISMNFKINWSWKVQ